LESNRQQNGAAGSALSREWLYFFPLTPLGFFRSPKLFYGIFMLEFVGEQSESVVRRRNFDSTHLTN